MGGLRKVLKKRREKKDWGKEESQNLEKQLHGYKFPISPPSNRSPEVALR